LFVFCVLKETKILTTDIHTHTHTHKKKKKKKRKKERTKRKRKEKEVKDLGLERRFLRT
jgi:hypothetical protein